MTTFHVTTQVLPGNKIQIELPDAPVGSFVEVYAVLSDRKLLNRKGVCKFIESLPPGPHSAPIWEEVEKQLEEERNAWDR